jgi:hypothetical protein
MSFSLSLSFFMSLSRTITPFTPHLFLGLRQGPPADYSNQPLNPHRVFA